MTRCLNHTQILSKTIVLFQRKENILGIILWYGKYLLHNTSNGTGSENGSYKNRTQQ